MAKRQRGSGFKPDDRRLWVGTLESIPRGWMVDPDFNDRALVGAGGAYSEKEKFGGDSKNTNDHTLSISQSPSHGHGYTTSNSGSYLSASYLQRSTSGTNTGGSTSNSGSSQAHNHGAVDVRQQSIGIYIIKRIR